MEHYTIIVLIFGILVFFLLVVLHYINKIYQYKVKIDNSFLVIKEILNNWDLLFTEIIDFLEKNLEHEKNLQNNLLKTKGLIEKVKNDSNGIEFLHTIESELEVFLELENTYLKVAKNKEYLMIKDKLQRNKDKLIYAMDSYDKGVVDYNNYKNNKFINSLTKLCRFPKYDCYNK